MLFATLLFAAAIAEANEANLPAILACPKVSVPRTANGTGVIIGTKDGYAYLLTAAHVIGDYPPRRESGCFLASQLSQTRLVPRQGQCPGALAGPGHCSHFAFRSRDGRFRCCRSRRRGERPKTFPEAGRSIGIGIGKDSIPTTRREVSPSAPGTSSPATASKPAFFWQTETPPRARPVGWTTPGWARPGHRHRGRDRRGERGYYAHHDEIVAALKRAGHGWLVPAEMKDFPAGFFASS